MHRRSASVTAYAPLTTLRYGTAALHVDLYGTRAVQRLSALPPQLPGSVRVVFVSDTHSQLADVEVPPGDIFCHTGDITFCANGGLQTLLEFNAQLAELPHAHKVVIAGNHDKRVEQLGRLEVRAPSCVRQCTLHSVRLCTRSPPPEAAAHNVAHLNACAQMRRLLSAAHYLENSGVRLCGLHFWGSPFSMRHKKKKSSNVAYQASRRRRRRRRHRRRPCATTLASRM